MQADIMDQDTVSLEALQDKEYGILEGRRSDPYLQQDTDKFMEANSGSMGEDSEEVTLREKRSHRLLRRGQIPISDA